MTRSEAEAPAAHSRGDGFWSGVSHPRSLELSCKSGGSVGDGPSAAARASQDSRNRRGALVEEERLHLLLRRLHRKAPQKRDLTSGEFRLFEGSELGVSPLKGEESSWARSLALLLRFFRGNVAAGPASRPFPTGVSICKRALCFRPFLREGFVETRSAAAFGGGRSQGGCREAALCASRPLRGSSKQSFSFPRSLQGRLLSIRSDEFVHSHAQRLCRGSADSRGS